ncbi:MAG: CHAT domain-containing protein, partial [Cryomorphaceae bacterium]
VLPPELLNKRNLLNAQMAELADAAAAFPDSAELAQKRSEIESKIKGLTQQIDSIDPQFDRLYKSNLSVSETQKKLGNRELIIQYVQGSKSAFAVLISREGATLYNLGSSSSIDSLITDYHQKLKTPGSEYGAASEMCYRTLVYPFRDNIEAYDHLVIIPDGKLSYLAFESLKKENTGEYLVHSHSISYSPSLSLWNLTADNSEEFTGSEKKRMAAFAPVYSDEYDGTMRSEILENRLVNLKGATREAELIALNFGGDFYTENEASKWNFIEQTNNYRVYHLAMHTIYADEDTENSELVFQNEEKLSFNEIYALHFPAEMVVLSACNTGLGQLREGEGMQSLSQALTYSGVQSSVYSLWPVPDKETAEIMLSFYDNLKLGQSKTTALAEAKRTFIAENPMKNHPYFWAGFVLQGNERAIIDEPTYWPYLLGVGILLLIFVGVVLRKRSAS